MSTPSPTAVANAIVLAAGTGSRAGGGEPKQLRMLAGRPVIAWSVAALLADARIERVVIAASPALHTEIAGLFERDARVSVAPGGETRRESVANALAHIDAGLVLVHDAARPIVEAEVLARLFAAMADGGDAAGATPALPIPDTIAGNRDGVLGDVADRGALLRIQTPQIFRTETLKRAHGQRTGGEATDDAQMVRAAGGAVAVVEGSERLAKITYPGDHERLESTMMASSRSATGMGYDVHRLVAGEELWLGGIRIEHDKGLAGHSDADVALHALTDAILGAIGAGDIGTHFPPSEPEWRGAASDRFLAHAAALVASKNAAIEHCDITIICETPKIGPHREAMRARIADILAIGIERVSVKATTTEGLGFVGRGEAIAAQAAATVRIFS